MKVIQKTRIAFGDQERPVNMHKCRQESLQRKMSLIHKWNMNRGRAAHGRHCMTGANMQEYSKYDMCEKK